MRAHNYISWRGSFDLGKVLWGGNFACLALLGYVIAGMLAGPAGPTRSDTPPKPYNTQKPARLARKSISPEESNIILERNIFGSASGADATPLQKAPAEEPIVKTKLQLRLLGTVAGDADVACAVIEDTSTKIQDLYRLGDVIQEARIERIERNRIILARGDTKEVLELSLTDVREGSSKTTVAQASPPKEFRPEGAIKVISPTQFEINKRKLLARIGGIEKILQSTRVTPYVVDGKTEGLRVTGFENVSMAKFIGLEDGDVIQIVNGQKLTSLQKAFQVFRKARGQSLIDIQLLRGNEKKTLKFDMK